MDTAARIVSQETPAATTRRARALFLSNPSARSTEQSTDGAAEAMTVHGFELIVPRLSDRASWQRAIEERAADVDLVIVAGGDGSLNAALQALARHSLPLGIVPLGTANSLAQTLGIPTGVEAACQVIAAGHTRRIDIACVNGVYYFNEMSVGLSATVSRILTPDAKRKLGVFALAARALQVMGRMRRFTAWVRCDGGPEDRLHTAQLTVGNSAAFGGFIANADAKIDDQQLELYSVSFSHWYSYLEGVQALLRQRYDGAETIATARGK
ncbi:MAG: NAD(+)/NADH kinase, partial [Candidatus Eremiobacteraeota bacterium]|nr:NAD(+)/NADH kinase [Candidatus Eremiobacteraeota bacterium]